MEKRNDQGNNLHVVMFPWLAMGHLIPFLQLSKLFASKGHFISFISTPRNLKRLPKIPPSLSPFINFISFPLPQVDGLPDQAESSMDIPHQKSQFLKKAFDLLKEPVGSFLDGLDPKPDWVVYDYASHWLPSLAAKNGVLCAYFSLFNAATMAFIGPPAMLLSEEHARTKPEDFTVVPRWIDPATRSGIVYRTHEVMKFMESAGGNESGTSDMVRFGVAIDESDFVLFRTCVEFEPEWFGILCELYRKPVVPVGALPPCTVGEEEMDDNVDNDTEEWIGVKHWLDKQGTNSVVYVALGTEAALSQNELTALALGLEQAGLPFFWVLRKSPGSTQDELDRLPKGYLERVSDRGFVYGNWAPQHRILQHHAIGGFLTHCGWNSIVEALSYGRVLILFPLMNDQGLTARLMQEKGLGEEIPRNGLDGSFTSDSVAESLRLAMVSQEGESWRAKASSMKGLFGDRDINSNYIDNCIHYLTENRPSAIRHIKN